MHMSDTTIQATVDQFVNDGKGFTSVDIANAIKTDGTWLSNRTVASWLRNWIPPTNYGVTKVTVQVADTGGVAQAGVYLPDTMAVSDYTATATEAMTPADFETLHGFDPFDSIDPVVVIAAVPADAPVKDYAPVASTDADPAPAADVTVGDKLKTMFKWPKTAK